MAGSSATRQLKTIPGFFSALVLASRLLENSQEDIHHHLAASRQVAQTARRKLPISISSNQWRWRWNAFETPGLEPVFPKIDEAIAYLRFLWIEVSFLIFFYLFLRKIIPGAAKIFVAHAVRLQMDARQLRRAVPKLSRGPARRSIRGRLSLT